MATKLSTPRTTQLKRKPKEEYQYTVVVIGDYEVKVLDNFNFGLYGKNSKGTSAILGYYGDLLTALEKIPKQIAVASGNYKTLVQQLKQYNKLIQECRDELKTEGLSSHSSTFWKGA